MDQKPIPSESSILIKLSVWVKGRPLLIGGHFYQFIQLYLLIPSVLKIYGKDMAIMVKNRAIDIFRV